MILACIALPGRLGAWCGEVLAALAGAEGDAACLRVWPPDTQLFGFAALPPLSLPEIGRALVLGSGRHAVVLLRRPDERLLQALSDTGARFVVALDDPRLAAADLLAESGAEAGLVTRAVANCCPPAMRFAGLPGALIVHGDRARSDIAGAVGAIARHLRLPARKARLARAATAIAASELSRALTMPYGAATPEPARHIIDGALASYAEQFAGGGFGRVVWRRELFIRPADGFARPTGILDLAGPPRTLIYGPYIDLPPGRWSARIVLGVSPQAAGSSFLIDAFADAQQLGHAVFVPASGGVHAVDIDFSVAGPSEKGLEIRVLTTSGNAAGQIALGHVELQPVAMRQPDAFSGSEDFESVLDL